MRVYIHPRYRQVGRGITYTFSSDRTGEGKRKIYRLPLRVCPLYLVFANRSTSARATTEDARSANDRAGARQLQIEAGLCLDEALKFYDDDNDLPPEEAFYSDDSRTRFRDRPGLFARQRLIELRGELPKSSAPGTGQTPAAEDRSSPPPSAGQHWWRRGQNKK